MSRRLKPEELELWNRVAGTADRINRPLSRTEEQRPKPKKPRAADPDPLPTFRIGQAAHDFQMAMGAPEVVLSRSFRSGKAPTVASRWLQRRTRGRVGDQSSARG